MEASRPGALHAWNVSGSRPAGTLHAWNVPGLLGHSMHGMILAPKLWATGPPFPSPKLKLSEIVDVLKVRGLFYLVGAACDIQNPGLIVEFGQAWT